MQSKFGALLRKAELKQRDEIDALAAKGIAPCSREGVWLLGVPGGFNLTYRVIDAQSVGIRVCVTRLAGGVKNPAALHIWGAPWPDHDLQVDATKLLGGLAAAWPVIARPFLRGSPPYQDGPRLTADFAASVAENLPKLVFVAEGRGLVIEHQSGRFDPKAECLIVVECLLTLGDLLAQHVSESPAASAWADVRGLADVFPWKPDIPPSNTKVQLLPGDEMAFYAQKFGIERESLRQWGLRYVAKWYLDNRYTPLPEMILDIPDSAEVSALVKQLGPKMGRNEVETIEAAQREFLIECRSHFYYKRWS